jgi:hypothetical protein
MLNMLQKTLLENLKCVEVQSPKLQRERDTHRDERERERERETHTETRERERERERRTGSPLEDDESTHHRDD